MTTPKTPSSPPFAAIGACCASGATRRDPWTGDERCQHCGLPVPLPNVAAEGLCVVRLVEENRRLKRFAADVFLAYLEDAS